MAGGAVPCAAQEAPAGPGVYHDTLSVRSGGPIALRRLIRADTFRLLAGGALVDTAAYRLDAVAGRLWLYRAVPEAAGPLVAVYATWPFSLATSYEIPVATPDTAGVASPRSPPREGPADLFGNARLQRSGSITRGLVAGSNRDVAVESGLRLQLSGEVAEGVRLQAVLTDENTPILPEGTTQRLSEFDKVFIQLEAPGGTAQLGDVEVALGTGTLARYTRKLQGVALAAALPAGRVAGAAHLVGATTRGVFRTQGLEALDGVQGPYRLEGAAGEPYVLVVPGSETVYLDGQRLVRGETNDYVIDYATGEITFTPRRLITAARRLRVEFQYRATEFTRTVVGAVAEAGAWLRADGTPRLRVGAALLREADGRQFADELGLTEADRALLAASGDAQAVRSGAFAVAYDPEALYVQYARTVRPRPDGGADTVYAAVEAPPAPGETVYRVVFTRVGAGQGAYVRGGRGVNGLTYAYRGPGQGDYAPVRVLPRPRLQQLAAVHGQAAVGPGVEAFGEWAGSLLDRNRFSPLDAADDRSRAYRLGLRLPRLSLGRAVLAAEVARRFTAAGFAAFDRTQPVEFARRWNLPPGADDLVQTADETIDEAFAQADLTARSRLRLEAGRLRRAGVFTGSRAALALALAEPGLPLVGYDAEAIASRDLPAAERGTWLRQQGRLAVPLRGGSLVPAVEVEQERRRQRVLGTDSLAAASLAFLALRPGLAWRREGLEAGATVEWRREEAWRDGTLAPAATAWTLQAPFAYRPSSAFFAEGTAGWRRRRFEAPFRARGFDDTDAALVQASARWIPWRRALDASLFYEAQTERTPVLQELYVRVGPEIGQFVWEDANGDGVAQLDEFVPERTPDEGTYVRTFVPSDSLASTAGVQARLRLSAEPARWFPAEAVGAARWLRVLTTRTLVEVVEKSRLDDLAALYGLNLRRFRKPGTTLSGRLRLAQELALWRGERRGLDLSFSQLRSLNELAAGQETRFAGTWRAEGRAPVLPGLALRLAAALETNRLVSTAFASRRYDVRARRLEPEAVFTPSGQVQATAGLALAAKDDRLGGRAATLWRVPVEARWNRPGRFQLGARFEAAHVALDGQAVGLAEYELTDGRGPGTSFLWGVSAQYFLGRYLRASAFYNGRAPEAAPLVHTFRLQLSATF